MRDCKSLHGVDYLVRNIGAIAGRLQSKNVIGRRGQQSQSIASSRYEMRRQCARFDPGTPQSLRLAVLLLLLVSRLLDLRSLLLITLRLGLRLILLIALLRAVSCGGLVVVSVVSGACGGRDAGGDVVGGGRLLCTHPTAAHVHLAEMSVQVIPSFEPLATQLTLMRPHARMQNHVLRHSRHQVRTKGALRTRIFLLGFGGSRTDGIDSIVHCLGDLQRRVLVALEQTRLIGRLVVHLRPWRWGNVSHCMGAQLPGAWKTFPAMFALEN